MTALDRLSTITTPSIALANKALATAFQQVAGITNLSLPQFAAAVAAQETTNNLPLIAAQTQPISQATISSLNTSIGSGTGPQGTFTIEDVLGTAAGVVEPQLANAVAIIANINTTTLTSTYQTMSDVVNGVYGDPVAGPVVIPTGPYANTYTDANDAFGNALIGGAQSDIANVISTYPTQTAQLNSDFNAIAQQVQTDKTNQATAQLVFSQLTANDTSTIYSFAQTLPQYGLNTVTDGSAQFINNTTDTSTLGGQAIQACLIQGRNEAALNAVGIQTTTHIPL